MKPKVDAQEALKIIADGMRSGSKALPGPVDSFKFGGVVWWRLSTPGGNSMIVGLPDAPTRKPARKKARK